MNNKIYIRDEYIDNEYRTPLVPNDIKRLIDNNFIIYIELSNKRIYTDNDYLKIDNRIIITNIKWYENEFKDALIIGLKDFNKDEYSKLNNHKHLYFSHSFKNQIDSNFILSSFKKSNSYIYDFEYFLDKYNKRLISFGFFAGIVGGFLGLYQYINKKLYNKNIQNLTSYKNYSDMVSIIKEYTNLYDIINNINICIIGHNGNSGKGVIDILSKLNIKYTIINRNFNKESLTNYDIFYNCILLNEQNILLYDEYSNFTKYITIVDISCDYSKKNNPIKLYNKQTTWENPVYEYNNIVDIIAINNLPSLLPKDSSDYFSSKLVDILLNYDYFINNQTIYENIINNL
jgi:saccharopine dehydrogenase (NAD+, L-lysine-forming)